MAIRKDFGYGTFALVLLLFGFLMNWNFGNDFIVSHSLFNILGLDIYSNGTDGFHYPFLASIPFWLAAVFVSKRNGNDFGAVLGGNIGMLMLSISVIVALIFLVLPIWIEI